MTENELVNMRDDILLWVQIDRMYGDDESNHFYSLVNDGNVSRQMDGADLKRAVILMLVLYKMDLASI